MLDRQKASTPAAATACCAPYCLKTSGQLVSRSVSQLPLATAAQRLPKNPSHYIALTHDAARGRCTERRRGLSAEQCKAPTLHPEGLLAEACTVSKAFILQQVLAMTALLSTVAHERTTQMVSTGMAYTISLFSAHPQAKWLSHVPAPVAASSGDPCIHRNVFAPRVHTSPYALAARRPSSRLKEHCSSPVSEEL